MVSTVLSLVAVGVGGGGLLAGIALMMERPRYLAAAIIAGAAFVSGAISPVLERLDEGHALSLEDMDRYTGAAALVALGVFLVLAAFVFLWQRRALKTREES